jgi:aspartate/methionine/tyrosine aminotransferase
MTTASELRLAKRMARLGTETAFEVLVKARALEAKGRDIVHLEIGEPDFDTPANIIGAATDALHKGFTHYGPSAGLPQLRETIAQYVSETRGVNVTPEEVVVVPGGKPIIFFSILALAEEGDEVIYPNPGFPIYESMINYVGAKAVPIRLREEMDFRLDVDELAGLINDRTKLLILNSPQNPTGGVLTKEDIDRIARAVGDRNVMVMTDEIYSRLIFEGEHHSIMSVDGMKERCILLDGFSKTYAMTGWRMGYGVMRADFATHVARLMTNSNSCTASFTPGGRDRGVTRAAGIGRDNVRGIPETAGRDGRRPQQDQRVFMSPAEGRVLRFPEHHQDRLGVEETGGRASRRSGCRRIIRHGVRRFR